MAGSRKAGSLGADGQPEPIDTGTLCRQLSPQPGTLCTSRVQHASEKLSPAHHLGPVRPSPPFLRQGNLGHNVKKLQVFLNSRMDLRTPLVVDGIFGPKTLAAVIEFQTSRSIHVDGEVGRKTWYHLISSAPAHPETANGGTLLGELDFPASPAPTDSVLGYSFHRKLGYLVDKARHKLSGPIRMQFGMAHAQSLATKLEAMADSELFDVRPLPGHHQLAMLGAEAVRALAPPTLLAALATTFRELDDAAVSLAAVIAATGGTELLGALTKSKLVQGGRTMAKLPSPQKQAPAKGPVAPKAPPPPLAFDPPKHWIGVKVVDEDGKAVKDVTVQCNMDDGFGFPVDLSKAKLEADGSCKTAKVLEGANCSFTFPSLFDVEWWPQGGSAGPAASVSPAPAADDGDCLISIADHLGFRSYHSIWDQAQNNALKKDRPNPDMLVTGDVLNAPDQKSQVVKKPLDQTWTFVVKNRKPFKLSLVLIDKDDKPLSGKAWELKTPVLQKDTTGGGGLVEITGLKPGDRAATLEVVMEAARTPPNKTPPAAPAAGPPPYPPVIAAEGFKDKMPNPDYSAQVVQWKLAMGGMPSFNVKTGVLARLHNLGFGCDVDADDETATRAVKAYQNLYLNDKNGSGVPADIQADIRDRHDKP